LKDKKKVKKRILLIANIILWAIVLYITISSHLYLVARLNYRVKTASNFHITSQDDYKTLVKNTKETTLVGESHGLNKTYIFLDNLLKEMNEQNKLNYLVIEASPSEAAIINLYLKSGDTNHIVNFISDNAGTALASQEFINIVQNVKAMNEKRKVPIRFIGVDIESSEKILLYYLKHEFQCFSQEQSLKEMWLRVSKAATISPAESREILNFIINNEKKLPLKEDEIFDIKMALTLRYSEKELISSEVMLLRDKKMKECYMAYMNYLPEGYFLVNMGSDHISGNKYTYQGKKIESFASLLSEDKKNLKQLYTINLEYLGGQSMHNQELGKSQPVSSLPYITFLKLEDKIVYPNTKAFNRIREWKKLEKGEPDFHMPSVNIILVNSDSVNSTNFKLKP